MYITDKLFCRTFKFGLVFIHKYIQKVSKQMLKSKH